MSTPTLEKTAQNGTVAPEYTPPDVTGLNLFQRLVLVKRAIGKVGKTAKAPAEMGGFNYVPWEGVADRVGDLLADHGIVALPSMPEYFVEQTADKVGSKQKTNYRTTVKLVYTLINAEHPEERHEMTWFGVGDDTSDKGLQKAGTNGTKYLLMKALMLGGMGGADDTDNTNVDGDSESTPTNYGPCPRPGCAGHIVRKSRREGADFAVCSTNVYRNGKASGCPWKDFEPNFEQYEQRAASLASSPTLGAVATPGAASGPAPVSKGTLKLGDLCPICKASGKDGRLGGTRERMKCASGHEFDPSAVDGDVDPNEIPF